MFGWLAKTGGVPREDLIRTFNCGIGMVVVVAPSAEARVTQTFKDNGETVYRIGSIVKRLMSYQETGNTELLVDVANLCLCEFVEGKHPNKHFRAVDDGEHVTV